MLWLHFKPGPYFTIWHAKSIVPGIEYSLYYKGLSTLFYVYAELQTGIPANTWRVEEYLGAAPSKRKAIRIANLHFNKYLDEHQRPNSQSNQLEVDWRPSQTLPEDFSAI